MVRIVMVQRSDWACRLVALSVDFAQACEIVAVSRSMGPRLITERDWTGSATSGRFSFLEYCGSSRIRILKFTKISELRKFSLKPPGWSAPLFHCRLQICEVRGIASLHGKNNQRMKHLPKPLGFTDCIKRRISASVGRCQTVGIGGRYSALCRRQRNSPAGFKLGYL